MTGPAMPEPHAATDRISIRELRESLEHMVASPWELSVDGLHGARTYLALVEAAEAAHALLRTFHYGIEIEKVQATRDALARFDFGSPL